jgi:translocation and assembly module TamB
MKRWLIRFGIGVAALLLVMTALAWFLGATETGLGWVVATVNAAPFTTTKIHIADARGTLVDGFTVGAVSVINAHADVDIKDIAGAADFWHLVGGSISLKRLSVGSVRVVVRRHELKSKTPLKFLPRLLRLHVARLDARNIDIAVPNGTHLIYDRVTMQAHLYSDRIVAENLDAHSELLSGRGSVELYAADPVALAGDLDWQLTAGHQPQWRGHAQIKGDLNRLAYGTDLAAPFHATSRGEFTNLTKSWRLHGTLTAFDFDVKAWKHDSTLGPATALLDVGGNRDGFSASGKVTPRDIATGPLRVRYRGRYKSRVLYFDELAAGPDQLPGELLAHGTITLTAAQPRLDFTGTWQQLQWPIRGRPTVATRTGQGTLTGDWPLKFKASGELRVRDLPAAQFTSAGEIAGGRIGIGEAHATWLRGTVDAQGEVRYGASPGWSVTARGTKLNPADWLKSWPGSLDFSLHAQAPSLRADSPWTVDVESVRGKLRAQTLRGSGAVSRLADGFGFDRVVIDLGSTHVRLDGSLTKEVALRWSVSSQDLAKTLPHAAGRINSTGSLVGASGAFAIDAHVDASALKYVGFSAQQLTADVKIDLKNRAPSKVSLTAQNISWSDHSVDTLTAALAGTTGAHDWNIAAQVAGARMVLGGHGHYAADVWTAGLERWTLDAPDGPHMKLTAPAQLMVGGDRLKLTTACIAADDGRFCAEGDLDEPGAWEIKASARSMPLKLLGQGLPGRPEFSGHLAMQLNATGTPGTAWTGAGRIDLSDAVFHYRLQRGQLETLTLGEEHVEFSATPEGFTGVLKIRATEKTFVDANVALTRLPDRALMDQTLTGALRAEVHELGLIPLFVTQVDRVDGTLTTQFKLSGTPRTPTFEGAVQLKAQAVDLYQINLQLRDTLLTARLSGNTLDVDGVTHAGTGQAAIQGQLAWNASQPHGELKFSGSNLRVVNVPEVRIVASPNLLMKVDGRRIDVSGEVTVPYARIAPVQLTGAVLSSSDEVIVGARVIPPEQRFQVYSRLKLVLGADVNVESYGLAGKLSGSVTATSSPGNPDTGVGELKVDRGTYTVLARRLDIERGRLLFNGGPLSNPGVDIRAVKRLPDIVAGANVRGTLREPRLSFFSDPPISQAQIVSLLVAGGTLESVQGSATTQVGGARNQILAQGGAILASELGAQLGLRDITVESDRQNETSLVLGKYLSPRLYISYGVSLTESINTIKLRYTLGDRWTIKTESGANSSADIVYTIEK